MLQELRRDARGAVTLPAQVLDHVDSYVGCWAGTSRGGDPFTWQADVHPDELEYLTNALYHLDLRLADEVRRCPAKAVPPEARAFHLVLVHSLLFALDQEGLSRAAFAEQLRPSWPVVAGVF